MSRKDLAGLLDLDPEDRRKLNSVLRELEAAGELMRVRKNRWARPARGRWIRGLLTLDIRGTGVVVDEQDPAERVRIPRELLGTAVEGDRVVVECDRREHRGRAVGDRFGRIVRVLERTRPVTAGLLRRTHRYWYVIPTDPHEARNVYITGASENVEFVEDHLVAVELAPWRPDAHRLEGVVVEDLGAPGTPAVEIQALIRRLGLAIEFPQEALREAMHVPRELSAKDLEGRRDHRDQECFTLDPSDARDFDDAVYAARRADGGWDVYVHIADVAHYVPAGSAIDREAFQRGTSVYLVDRALTMLPPELTTDICSLKPEKDRLSHTVHVRLDSELCVVEAHTYPSIIRSRARLNYDDVQAFLMGQSNAGVPAALRERVRELFGLTSQLRRRRIEAGALAFTMPEVRCELDNVGRILAIRRRGADEAYSLIEELMLLANCAVARRLWKARYPAIYRIHEEPDARQWEAMETELWNLGQRGFEPDPHALNRILAAVAGSPREHIVALAILRNLKRAQYSADCQLHFGLAVRPYTHFTSPIRRYPDLVVHRVLRAIENHEPPPLSRAAAEAIAEHSSQMERLADEAERESVEISRIEYYDRLLHQGDVGPWEGIVVDRIRKGWIVELVDTLQRGLLADVLVRKPLSPGQAISVRLARVDTHRKWVDFAPADGERPAGRGRHRTR